MSRRYVGSGDVAAIVAHYRPELEHLAKWKNISDVWLRLVHDIDVPHKKAFNRGLREENPLRRVYRETIGPVSELPGMVQHPRFPWAGGSPDGLAPGLVVELKTHSVFAMQQWGDEPWSDRVPDKYNLQTQWLMGLTNRPEAHLLVGFGRDALDENGEDIFTWLETRPYRIAFDAELYAELETLAERFYLEHVQTKLPPSCKPVSNRREFKRLTHGHAVAAEQ